MIENGRKWNQMLTQRRKNPFLVPSLSISPLPTHSPLQSLPELLEPPNSSPNKDGPLGFLVERRLDDLELWIGGKAGDLDAKTMEGTELKRKRAGKTTKNDDDEREKKVKFEGHRTY